MISGRIRNFWGSGVRSRFPCLAWILSSETEEGKDYKKKREGGRESRVDKTLRGGDAEAERWREELV